VCRLCHRFLRTDLPVVVALHSHQQVQLAVQTILAHPGAKCDALSVFSMSGEESRHENGVAA
jgi:hypothetical protein